MNILDPPGLLSLAAADARYVRYVAHGYDGDIARPAAALVVWAGEVNPSNAITGDIWVRKSVNQVAMVNRDFDMSTIPGLLQHYDFADESSVTAAATVVSAVANQVVGVANSGLGLFGTSTGPIYDPATYTKNGLAVLHLPTTTSFMRTTGDINALDGDKTLTIIGVFRVTNSSGFALNIGYASGTNALRQTGIGRNTSSGHMGYVRKADGSLQATGDGEQTDAWVIVVAVWNDTTLDVYVDGAQMLQVTGLDRTPTSHLNTHVGTDTVSPMTGDIAELVVSTEALGDTDRLSVESALALKWDLTLDVPLSAAPTEQVSVGAEYEAWPYIAADPDTSGYVVVYHDGPGHNTGASVIDEQVGTPGVPAGTWTPADIIYDSGGTEISTVEGVGVDGAGNLLAWVRNKRLATGEFTYDLIRRISGVWSTIYTPSWAPWPGNETISSSVSGPVVFGDALVSVITSNALGRWGVVVGDKDDPAAAWAYTQFASGLADEPNEVRLTKLASGDLIGIGRTENASGVLWQLTLGAGDDPAVVGNWTLAQTNISDQSRSPGCIVEVGAKVYVVYYDRLTGRLRYRSANTGVVYADPTQWSASTVLAIGSASIHGGYPHAILADDGVTIHVVWYTGGAINTAVLLTQLDTTVFL